MRTYHFTELGEDTAQKSGLRDMALRVTQDYPDDIIEGLLRPPLFEQELDDALEEGKIRVNSAWRSLKDDDEKREFIVGIDPKKIDGWRRLVSPLSQSLLDLPETEKYDETVAEDGLVLSGLIGLQYLRERLNCRLLSRSRFREFGFDNFIDAASFVGAYVLTQAGIAKRHSLRFDREPFFEINEGDLSRKLTVAGDFHGDFRLSETTTLKKPTLAPNGKFVEFNPEQNVRVAAYHSTEPSIIAAMMEGAFLDRGRAELTVLLSELSGELTRFSHDSIRMADSFSGNFGDYGEGDAKRMIVSIRYLLNNKDFANKKQLNPQLFSEAYLPRSASHFEILRSDDDLIFQNRYLPGDKILAQIKLPREYFAGFFGTLLRQCQAGLGRTSPAQLFELVQGVKQLL